MPTRDARFPLFDGLRAIAALSIVLLHALYQPAVAARQGEWWWPLGVHLDVGVPIFFAISGFLLYRPFVTARLGGRRVSLAAYGWRRLLRIVPAYWVALTVITLWFALDEVQSARGVATFYGFAQVYDADTALRGMGQAWTLDVEILFYAFLPLWALAMARVRDAAVEVWALGGLVVASLAWKVFALSRVDPQLPESFPWLLPFPGWLDHLALGMLLAVLSAHGAGRGAERRAGWAWAGALACWLAACFLAGPDGSPGDVTTDATYLWRHVLYGGVAVLLLVPAVFGSSGAVARFLGWRPVAFVGLVSYSLYLWHFAAVAQLARWWDGGPTGLGWVPWLALALGGSLALAVVSYYVVERPAMSLRRLVPADRSAGAADQPGAASVPAVPP